MDWFQIIINCILFIGTAVVVIVGIWLVCAIPVMLVWFVASFFYNIIRFFLPFLPSSDQITDDLFKSSPKKSSYSGKTEIQKQYELNEHIRQQQMNEQRNQR